jgi:hypothetical protein
MERCQNGAFFVHTTRVFTAPAGSAARTTGPVRWAWRSLTRVQVETRRVRWQLGMRAVSDPVIARRQGAHQLAALWHAVVWIVMVVVRAGGRPRLALGYRPPPDAGAQGASGSLDAGGSYEPPTHRRWRMGGDWRWLLTETGTALLVLCVAESGWQTFGHSFERALHLHLALGISRGFALVLIAAVLGAQTLGCLSLLVPQIYLKTGAILPSSVLAATLWFETLLFGDLGDQATVARSASLTAAAVMLALFRFDRQARNAQQQIPTSDTLLNIEAAIRRVCTRSMTGMVLPPLALLLLAWSVAKNPYWHAHGIVYEWYRGRLQAGVASSSLLFLVAGQDTKAAVHAADRWERARDWFQGRKELLLGQPPAFRPMGRKKSL